MFKILDGREHFYQWDLNRQIQVEDSTIKQLHFCNKTDDCSLVVEVVNGVANVPNILLQTSWDIRVYGYTGDYTKVEKRFKVVARTKPSDYVYTETEVKSYEELSNRINSIGSGLNSVSSKLNVVDDKVNNLEDAVSTIGVMARSALDKAENVQSIAENAASRAYNNMCDINYILKPKVTALETQVGDIENALTQIAALQGNYIGGAE